MEHEDKIITIARCKCEILKQDEDKVPQMKVSLLDTDGNVITKGYLSAFLCPHGHRFQVAEDIEGTKQIAGTEYVDLYDILVKSTRPNDTSTGASTLYYMFAELAMYNFIAITINDGNGKIVSACNVVLGIDNDDNHYTLAKFIDDCLKYAIKEATKRHIWHDEYAIENGWILNPKHEVYCEN